MYTHELEKIIIDSLDDFKFDQDEKYFFKNLSDSLSDDQIRFIKNKSFELSRPYVEKGGVDAIRVLNWLERIIKSIQPVNKRLIMESSAYFSPGNSCRNKIINLLNEARSKVDICVFTISDNKITEAILNAYQRGIDITIISDNDKANDRGSDIDYLSGKGLNVILDHTSYHMHHKFAVFDQTVLLNGSFNWTRSASDVNEENILITYDAELVSLFDLEFERLKNKLAV